MYKRIVWPFDLSKEGRLALPHLQSLAEAFQSVVHLVYVAPDLGAYGRWWGEPLPEHVEHLHRLALDKAGDKMNEFCTEELAACPSRQIHIQLGEPVTEILQVVERVDADLIVMTTEGLSGYFPAGSVTERLIRCAAVPVLVINAPTAR